MTGPIEHLASSLRALKAARTSLKRALEHGASVELWSVHDKLSTEVIVLATRLRTARLARLAGGAKRRAA